MVLVAAEFDRLDSRITPGSFKYDPDDDLIHEHGFLSGCHVVFKANLLKQDEVTSWSQLVGKQSKKMERINKRWQRVDDPDKCGYVNLVGYTSAYETPEAAL